MPRWSIFILVFEIVLNLIKGKKDMHALILFDHTFLYTAHDDDATFFLKVKESLMEVMNVFDTFFYFFMYSCLKHNKSKCENVAL